MSRQPRFNAYHPIDKLLGFWDYALILQSKLGVQTGQLVGNDYSELATLIPLIPQRSYTICVSLPGRNNYRQPFLGRSKCLARKPLKLEGYATSNSEGGDVGARRKFQHEGNCITNTPCDGKLSKEIFFAQRVTTHVTQD